jgi:large subunit ribosomal protein L3
MKGLLGKKIGTARIFDGKGTAVSVTVIEAGPCPVLQVKTNEKDGYKAVQLGFCSKKEKNTPKAIIAHCKKAGVSAVRMMKEFSYENTADIKLGTLLSVEVFADVQLIDVTGYSKGRGFTGTIKRHNFMRGRETHGNKNHRGPGSVGNHTYPARVWPGKRLPGRYGNTKVTAKNLRIMKIDTENNLIVVKGSVPGPQNGYLVLCESTNGKGQ